MTVITAPRLHYPAKRLNLCQLILTQTRKKTMATFINVFCIKLLSLILTMEVIAEIISCKTMLDFAIFVVSCKTTKSEADLESHFEEEMTRDRPSGG